MSAPLLPKAARSTRGVASLSFAAALSAVALIVVVFSADNTDTLLQLSQAPGGYALPPGEYDGFQGRAMDTRDHSRWWEHAEPSTGDRKPAHPKMPVPTHSDKPKTAVALKPDIASLPVSMREAMVRRSRRYRCGKLVQKYLMIRQ
jgi:hypothetical protein